MYGGYIDRLRTIHDCKEIAEIAIRHLTILYVCLTFREGKESQHLLQLY